MRPSTAFKSRCPAAQAAKAFQPTRSRAAADAALPPLVIYYRLLASAVPGGFDVAEAARLELDWWQARREAVGPRQYGVTVARLAASTYGKPADDPSLLITGIGRAEAMAYRDARGQAMTDPDWSKVECRSRRAYWSLKVTVELPFGPKASSYSRQQKSPGRCRGFGLLSYQRSVLGLDRSATPVEAVDQRCADGLHERPEGDVKAGRQVAAIDPLLKVLAVKIGRTIFGLHEPAGSIDSEDAGCSRHHRRRTSLGY